MGSLTAISVAELREAIRQHLLRSGWQTFVEGNRLLATREDILLKWLLGRKSVRLDLECIFDEAVLSLQFRETAIEKSRGLLPPTLSLHSYRQSGTTVEEKRHEIGLGGGGKLHYGQVRPWIETVCTNAGWTFHYTIGLINRPRDA